MIEYKFMLALRTILILLLLCFPVYSYDLTQIPKYSFEETNKHYPIIADVNIGYHALNRVYFKLAEMGIKPNKKQEHEILVAVDIYLYWLSIATIQLFNEEYDKMIESTEKASKGLDQFKSILVEVVKDKST